MAAYIAPRFDPPKAPPSRWWPRVELFKLVTSVQFETSVAVVLVLNMVVLVFNRYEQPETERRIIECAAWAFLSLYVVELVLKVVGLGVRQFLRSRWNVFDSTIVAGSLVLVIVAPPMAAHNSGIIRAIRLFFRSMRVLRLLSFTHFMRKVVQTLQLSLPALGSMMALVGIGLRVCYVIIIITEIIVIIVMMIIILIIMSLIILLSVLLLLLLL